MKENGKNSFNLFLKNTKKADFANLGGKRKINNTHEKSITTL